jgi:hypothetical protein
MLRRIFGPRREEVTGDWRKLHNEELHNFYSSPNIIKMIKSRRMRRARHVARMGETRNAYRILVGKAEEKRPLGRTRPLYFHSIYLSMYLWLYRHFVGIWRFFSFVILYTVRRTPWTEDQSVARPIPAHRTTQTSNALRGIRTHDPRD